MLGEERVQQRLVQENVDAMKAAVVDIDEEHSDEEFAEKVQREHDLRKRLYGEGTLECQRCHKPFETQRLLKWHVKRCRPVGG